MSEEFQDEITSINSIYGERTLVEIASASGLYTLTLPVHPSISLRLEFPADYPDVPPSVLGTQSVGDDVAKGEGAQLVELVRGVLAEVYQPGAPCIFDLVEDSGQKFQQQLERRAASAETQTAQAHGQHTLDETASLTAEHVYSDSMPQPPDHLGEPPPWTLSEVVSEKKSVFVARSAPVTSVEQAKAYLAHLLATDKKVVKATHNITAWRIRGEHGVQFQDCDDDGETAAGGRVLHLLELMNVWNAMVVVTRWYGGIQLGPDRFRIINQTARDAMIAGGFASEGGKDNKKKGKK